MRSLFLCMVLFLGMFSLAAAPPQVVVTIKPLHALVSAVMQGVATPSLLVPEGASSHEYQLSPSGLHVLSKAELLFWIGPAYEGFLKKPLENMQSVVSVAMMDQGVSLLSQRQDPLWEGQSHSHHHDHDSNMADPHCWLDPLRAIEIVQIITESLAAKDREHAQVYRLNAAKLVQQLKDLDKELGDLLQPVQGRPFLVFHDGLQYFEKRYHLAAKGAIVVNPEIPLGAKRLAFLQRKLKKAGIVCVLREPEFQTGVVQQLIEGTQVKETEIDTLGATIERNEKAYLYMMRQLGKSMKACLSP